MIAENDGAFTWIDSQTWGWNLQFHSYIHSFWVHNVDRTRISWDLASPNIDPAMSWAGRFPLKKVLRVYVSWGDSTHFCWRNLEIQMVLDKITIPGHIDSWRSVEICWNLNHDIWQLMASPRMCSSTTLHRMVKSIPSSSKMSTSRN